MLIDRHPGKAGQDVEVGTRPRKRLNLHHILEDQLA